MEEIITSVIMRYLRKKGSVEVKSDLSGRFHLKLARFYLYFGCGSLSLGLSLFVLCMFTIEDSSGWKIGLLFLTIFGGLSLPIIIVSIMHSVSFDDKIISSTNVYGNTSQMSWEEIIDINFNAFTSFIVFKKDKGVKVKAHQHLMGILKMYEGIEKYTAFQLDDLNLPPLKTTKDKS